MATRNNHPEEVTTDLLCDMIARLDHMLAELGRAESGFRAALGADPAQGSKPKPPLVGLDMICRPTSNAIVQELARAATSRSRQQLLFDLHCLNVKLSSLILELEESLPEDAGDDS